MATLTKSSKPTKEKTKSQNNKFKHNQHNLISRQSTTPTNSNQSQLQPHQTQLITNNQPEQT